MIIKKFKINLKSYQFNFKLKDIKKLVNNRNGKRINTSFYVINKINKL